MLNINFAEVDRLEQALKNYKGNAESAINEVMHGSEVSDIAYEKIRNLMPKSKKKKGRHAKDAQSLRSTPENLGLLVRTTKAYQYLYFPDDGTNTRRHVGYKGIPRRFFAKGGEAATGEIVERCVERLIKDFESEVN